MENKLKEALKKLGIETVEQLNAAIKTEKPLDIGIMTSEVAKETVVRLMIMLKHSNQYQ